MSSLVESPICVWICQRTFVFFLFLLKFTWKNDLTWWLLLVVYKALWTVHYSFMYVIAWILTHSYALFLYAVLHMCYEYNAYLLSSSLTLCQNNYAHCKRLPFTASVAHQLSTICSDAYYSTRAYWYTRKRCSSSGPANFLNPWMQNCLDFFFKVSLAGNSTRLLICDAKWWWKRKWWMKSLNFKNLVLRSWPTRCAILLSKSWPEELFYLSTIRHIGFCV